MSYEISPILIASMVRESLAKGQPAKLTIISGSMVPFLKLGDQVEVELYAFDQLAVGDVVLFEHNENIFTHRLRGIDGKSLLTRGDHPLQWDAPIPQEGYIGRVSHRIRNGRRHALWDDSGMVLQQKLIALVLKQEKKWLASYDLTAENVVAHRPIDYPRWGQLWIRLQTEWLVRKYN